MNLIAFIAWSLFILVVIFIIVTVLSFCLAQSNNTEEINPQKESELQDQNRRKWIGLFVLAALVLIMTMTGINAFLNIRT